MQSRNATEQESLARVVAFITEKGGAGKTSNAVSFAYWLCQEYPDAMVVLADSCKAKHSTRWGKHRVDNAFPEAPFLQVELTESLAASVRKMKSQYDFIVIDGSPSIDKVMTDAMKVADAIVIPLKPEGFSLECAIRTAETMLDTDVKDTMRSAFLCVDWETNTNNVRDIEEALPKVGLPIIKQKLISRTLWKSTLTKGTTVHEAEPRSAAAQEATNVYAEIMETML